MDLLIRYCIFAALLLTGCADVPSFNRGPVTLWAMPGHADIFSDTEPVNDNEIFTTSDRAVQLTGGVNETIGFQLACSAGEKPASIQNVTMTDLRHGESVIPVESIAFYREQRVAATDFPSWYLRLTPQLGAPRSFGDVLVPLTAPRGALPIDIEAGQTEAIWTDVHIPLGTEQGIYTGTILVSYRDGGSDELNVSLTVWPFALPQARHIDVIAGVRTSELFRQHLIVNGKPYIPTRVTFDDPTFERAIAVIDDTVRLLHDHRLSPILSDVRPSRTISAQGLLEVDWSDYDRLVSSSVDGTAFQDRLPAAAWPMPINDRNPRPEAYGGATSERYERIVRDYLDQCVSHFESKGWLDRHYIWMDVPHGQRAEGYARYQRTAALLREVDARLNIVCPLTPYSMELYGWRNDPFVDVSQWTQTWAPPASLADPDQLARTRAAGQHSWLWPDKPPFAGSLSMLAPSVHARSLAWLAYRFGHDAIFLPFINLWPEDGVPTAEDSPHALIWPGQPYGLDAPVPSIRLKRLRRGLQDYEMLWLLEQNARPGIAALIAEDLHPFGGTYCYGEHMLDGRPGGWVADSTAWSLARRLMARELAQAVESQGTDGSKIALDSTAQFQKQIDWARLTERVREIRVELEGVRVRFDHTDTDTPVHLEAVTTLFNATRKPISGKLIPHDWPSYWEADGETTGVQSLAPARATRRKLAIHTPTLQPNSDGVAKVEVAFETEDGTRTVGSGRVCALMSAHVDGPMTINGHLDDWPLGTTNVAGDFLLVGSADAPKTNRFSPDRPSQRTIVFVCDDDEYLYIAFNCEDDGLSRRRITRSNHVAYDDLWPSMEDLVEVLLDPTGNAVDASEMIHIVVKANGAVVTERGVPCLTTVADHRLEPLAVTAVIDDRSHPNKWVVEMRIPLHDLGPRNEVWGVNFARFMPRLGEYSNWSGSRRFVYTPVSLGNMKLQPLPAAAGTRQN